MFSTTRTRITPLLVSLLALLTLGAGATAQNPVEHVKIVTTMGDIVLELDRKSAPVSVENFLGYTNSGFYDGTIYHRVIGNFMIQGGGFDESMKRKPTKAPIANEWENGLKNVTGSIAMARTTNPDSATSQFFINVVDNAGLDKPVSGGAGYAVFGKVIEGMGVVNEIRSVSTGIKNGMRDVPAEPIVMTRVRQLTKGDDGAWIEKELVESAATAAATPAKPAKKESSVPDVVRAEMKTSMGTIVLELDGAKAPITVANFVAYAQKGHYDGTIFHRVIGNFMIQGGGFTPEMDQKPTGDGIENEWQNGLKNMTGTIAMARTSDPSSATAQFFINVKDNGNLDQPISGGAGYAVFGKVVEGMDVVNEIRGVTTGVTKGFRDVPVEVITIEKVTVSGEGLE